MKKIVNGLLYDTEKAEVVSKYKAAEGLMTLYRTKKGHYFLHTNYTTFEEIRVMTVDKTFEWLANYDLDKAKELFPEKILGEA